MANARAIANGNWSATSTWNGGTLPGNGDTVWSNGYTVTIDQNIIIGDSNNPTINAGSFVSGQWYQILTLGTTTFTTIGASANTVGTIFQATGAGSGTGTAKALATLTTATNTAAGATTGGGGFTMSTAYNVNADIRAGTTTCLTVSATTGTVNMAGVVLYGSSNTNGSYGINNSSTATISATGYSITNLNTGTNSNSQPIVNSSGGTINLISCSLTNTNGNVANAVLNNSSGQINVTNGSISSIATSGTIQNASIGTITITNATIVGGTNSTGTGINNASTGTVTITGSTLTAGSGGAALNNTSTGTINCSNCTFTASTGANAVSSTNAAADVRLSGSFYDAVNGYKAVYSPKWRLDIRPIAARTRYALDGTSTFVEMYTADNTGIAPAVGDVRFGVVYGSAVGTCRVPAAASVAAGVLVDVSSTGTAVLTAADVQAALAAQGLTTSRAGNLDNLDATVSSRLAPSGTLATVTTLTNAPASVTPAQIRAEMDANSTKLANLDATVSSRLAGSSYTAPSAAPTAADNASAVWAAATRTLTSASGPTATQIRQEMDANSTKLANLDSTVSSRLAASAYIAPTTPPTAAQVRAEIDTNSTQLAAIKTKTDALNTDRLSQTATTAIVGALIAQANS
jgi:hypothetical protein